MATISSNSCGHRHTVVYRSMLQPTLQPPKLTMNKCFQRPYRSQGKMLPHWRLVWHSRYSFPYVLIHPAAIRRSTLSTQNPH